MQFQPGTIGRQFGVFLREPQMIRCNIRTGFGCAVQRKAVLGSWSFDAGELEERACRNEAAIALLKVPPSDLKLKTEPPRRPEGGQLKLISLNSIRFPAARVVGAR
jgi:hypothetical protein